MTIDTLGTFLRAWEPDGGSVALEARHEQEIDAAFSQWVERGVDRVLRLTLAHGDEYVTKASQIEAFTISTPDGRRRATELEAAAGAEDVENRKAVGLPVRSDGEEWRTE